MESNHEEGLNEYTYLGSFILLGDSHEIYFSTHRLISRISDPWSCVLVKSSIVIHTPEFLLPHHLPII